MRTGISCRELARGCWPQPIQEVQCGMGKPVDDASAAYCSSMQGMQPGQHRLCLLHRTAHCGPGQRGGLLSGGAAPVQRG